MKKIVKTTREIHDTDVSRMFLVTLVTNVHLLLPSHFLRCQTVHVFPATVMVPILGLPVVLADTE